MQVCLILLVWNCLESLIRNLSIVGVNNCVRWGEYGRLGSCCYKMRILLMDQRLSCFRKTKATNGSLEVGLTFSPSSNFQSSLQVPSPCDCLRSLTQITKPVLHAQALCSYKYTGEGLPDFRNKHTSFII